MNGCYYETFDYDTIRAALMDSVWNGRSQIVMKFGSPEPYETAKYELFQNNMLKEPGEYLMEINGVSSWNYRYHTDDEFYLITIYCFGELIRAGCRARSAVNTFKACDSLRNFHAFYQSGDTLGVSGTSAYELYVLDRISVELHMDFT